MSSQTSDDKKRQALKDLDKIREIINAEALEQAKAEQLSSARQYVAQVFSEALADRQQQDQSVSKVLVPIVSEAVQETVQSQRKQMADYLYPLVGELVRKFSLAFLRDFIEKTNELIEHSLTPKSIVWRFKAWRSGIGFSRYVASQVYTYQVHQVLLIHKESGILLNAQSADASHDENSDLVSAMLSAINDFVNDSFASNKQLTTSSSIDSEPRNFTNDESLALDEIKTDEFTLYVKQGPQAILVAAVTGNISPKAKYKLQTTLENIHAFYLPQLQVFSGETSVFDGASSDLRECLVREEKDGDREKTQPWFAISLMLIVLVGAFYLGFLSWQTHSLESKLYELPQDQGIVIKNTEIEGFHDIQVQLFRDPNALSVNEWLSLHPNGKLATDWLAINEIPYASLAPAIIEKQIRQKLKSLNAEVVIGGQNNTNNLSAFNYDATNRVISGNASEAQLLFLKSSISEIQGISQLDIRFDVKINEPSIDKQEIAQRALTLLSGRIDNLQIDFELASDTIPDDQRQKLIHIRDSFVQLQAFATELGFSAKILVLGASDNVGQLKVNQALSIGRARNTATALEEIGIPRDDLMTSGLGIISDAPEDTNVRKAIIHVILNDR